MSLIFFLYYFRYYLGLKSFTGAYFPLVRLFFHLRLPENGFSCAAAHILALR